MSQENDNFSEKTEEFKETVVRCPSSSPAVAVSTYVRVQNKD